MSCAFKIKTPAGIFLSGPSASGKTFIAAEMIRRCDQLFETPIDKIYYCYGLVAPELPHDDRLQIMQGAPSMDILQEEGVSKLVFLDDLQVFLSKNKGYITNLFTRVVHHCNCTIVNMVQNLFSGIGRDARINAQYLILTKNLNDRLQIKNAARQLMPHNTKFLEDAYADSTKEGYGMFVIDNHIKSDDNLRYLGNIFTDPVVYMPKPKFSY